MIICNWFLFILIHYFLDFCRHFGVKSICNRGWPHENFNVVYMVVFIQMQIVTKLNSFAVNLCIKYRGMPVVAGLISAYETKFLYNF